MAEEVKHSDSVGSRVRQLRQRRGWSVEQLARDAKISKGFLSQVENDKTQPTGPVLLRLANSLSASVDYLLKGAQAVRPDDSREPLQVPLELAELASELGWSARRVFRLLGARKDLLARRSDRQPKPFTRADWRDFAARLEPYLGDAEE